MFTLDYIIKTERVVQYGVSPPGFSHIARVAGAVDMQHVSGTADRGAHG